MTGIEIFIGGGIFLCNAVLIAYLIKSDKKKGKSLPEDKSPDIPSEDSVEKTDSASVVAPSKFDVDKFMAELSAGVLKEVKKELHTILSSKVGGDVAPEDVKFEAGYEDDDDSFIPQKNITPLNPEQMEDAFNTDDRDIDQAPPSEPLPPAASIDELEKAVETAMSEESTDKELAEAGKVIEPFVVTQVYDFITSNEEIDRRVDLCLRMALRAELSMKAIPSKKQQKDEPTITPEKKEEPPKQKVKDKSLKIDFDNIDPDSFDINSILGE